MTIDKRYSDDDIRISIDYNTNSNRIHESKEIYFARSLSLMSLFTFSDQLYSYRRSLSLYYRRLYDRMMTVLRF